MLYALFSDLCQLFFNKAGGGTPQKTNPSVMEKAIRVTGSLCREQEKIVTFLVFFL